MLKLTPAKICARPWHNTDGNGLEPAPFPGKWPTKVSVVRLGRSYFDSLYRNIINDMKEVYIGVPSKRALGKLLADAQNSNSFQSLLFIEFDRKNSIELNLVRGGRIQTRYRHDRLLNAYWPRFASSTNLIGRLQSWIDTPPFLKRLKGVPFPYYDFKGKLNTSDLAYVRNSFQTWRLLSS